MTFRRSPEWEPPEINRVQFVLTPTLEILTPLSLPKVSLKYLNNRKFLEYNPSSA